MNFFKHIFEYRERTTTPSEPRPQQEQAQTAKGGSFGDNSVSVRSPSAALAIAAFQRAVVLRANTMSQLLMQYQRLDRHGGNYVEDTRDEEARHLKYILQTRPNRIMSAPVMFRQAMMNVDLKGNAVIFIERNDGVVGSLYLCDSASYNIIEDKYEVTYKDIRGVHFVTADSCDIIHLKGALSNDNSLSGESLLAYGARVLGIAATNDNLVLENASKGGKIKLLVQEEKTQGFGLGRANRKELEKITRELNEDIYAQDVVLMSNVAGVTPISQNMQQQDMQNSRAFSVREIARITGVPPVLLMDNSNSSYKSPEAATQEFLLRTIAPIIREWEAEFDSKLLGEEGLGPHRFHLCEKPLLRLDPIAAANVAKVQLETGVKTVNDLRAEQDMPFVDGGDKALVSTNLQEIANMKVTPDVAKGGES